MPIVQVSNLDTHPTEVINLDCRTSFVTTINQLCSDFATVMPFRVNFQTVDMGAYSPSNPAPIGIAIIGFNNYIL
jgi:hypothetical protein